MEGKNSIFDPIIGFGFGNLPETDLFRMLFALNFHMKGCFVEGDIVRAERVQLPKKMD
jgi:hypothetical protein